jgi:membrane protease YdiL (CAAX protease family)
MQRLTTAALVAGLVFLTQYFPDRGDLSGAVLGAVFAFGAVAIGLAAVAAVRPMPARSATERFLLMSKSIALGVAVGLGNLIVNYGIARLDPAIQRQMVEQWATFSTWSVVFAGPIVEEIAYRLALMGGIAWLVSRFTDDRRIVFLVALAVPSLLFGVAHVLPSSRPTTGVLHAITVAVKSAAGGLVFGWVFWRRGLPYSIACHGTANAIHFLAAPVLF